VESSGGDGHPDVQKEGKDTAEHIEKTIATPSKNGVKQSGDGDEKGHIRAELARTAFR